MSTMKVCSHPGCAVEVHTAGRCPRHQREHNAARNTKAYRTAHRPIMACPSCGTITKMTIDHIVPLHAGGANDDTNWAWLCLRCNSGKKDK